MDNYMPQTMMGVITFACTIPGNLSLSLSVKGSRYIEYLPDWPHLQAIVSLIIYIWLSDQDLELPKCHIFLYTNYIVTCAGTYAPNGGM